MFEQNDTLAIFVFDEIEDITAVQSYEAQHMVGTCLIQQW